MYCENCGSKLKENSKFCGNCGAKVTDQTGKDEKAASKDIENFEDRFNLIPATKSFEDILSCDPDVLSILKNNKFSLSVESKVLDNNTYAFLVNINTKDNNILQLQHIDGKQIAFIFGKYIFEFKDNQIHHSLHDEFDNNVNFQIYVLHNDGLIYNLADEKKVSNNSRQNENLATNSDIKRNINPSNMMTLEFEIKRGVVDADSIEDDDVQSIFEECLNLCKNNKHQEAADLLYPIMSFEWSWSNCDGDAEDIFDETDDIFFECNKSNTSIRVGESDGDLIITASAKFEVAVKKGTSSDTVTEWLDENSAYACGYLSGGWGYSGSDGDNVWLVNN